MTPPADPIRPLSGAEDERFLTTSPIERVHRRERREEDGDHSEQRRQAHRAEQWHRMRAAAALQGLEEGMPVPDTYDDHGRVSRKAPGEVDATEPVRHIDARA